MSVSPGDIISHREMCNIENATLQRGMNYRLRPGYSVVLMSRRDNAPYKDKVSEDGRQLVYEGHDEPRSAKCPIPKSVDQPLRTAAGTLTQNGKFFEAAELRGDTDEAEKVRVYEKIMTGIWVYNGLFRLRDAKIAREEGRKVCNFILELDPHQPEIGPGIGIDTGSADLDHTRVIPSHVKIEVWKRDKGRCRECEATDNLHFDHIVPYSRGGTSIKAENIQLLCARHNLEKSDKIQ